jgi:hypothetical protein
VVAERVIWFAYVPLVCKRKPTAVLEFPAGFESWIQVWVTFNAEEALDP